jgi:acetylornithine/LysW-gamma-L-lysine aminotransferase
VKFVRFYQDRGLTIVKGEGQYVWDDKGQKYLDLHAGYGTAFLGHRNKVVIEYMQKQMERITNLTTAFDVPIRDEMLKELDKVKPEGMEYVYLLNSGTEGNELALKIAKKLTKRRKIVAFKNGFHGRTMGSLSVTWNRNYREQFGPMLQEVEFLDYNNVDGLKLINEETAGVIVEPVQGEGGVVPAKQEFMRELRTRTESSGSLLIVDEVQTGFGRTGEIWGHQHYGVKADIVVAGKAIGGGFPVSAVFLPEWIAQGLGEGDHGSTYGGNPLALAAVTAATKVLTNDSVHQKAKEKGEIFMKVLSQGLQGMKSVREVRGKGLMIGIDLRFNPSPVIKAMQDSKVLCLKAGSTVVRLLPPYVITEEDMEVTVDVARKAIRDLETSKGIA